MIPHKYLYYPLFLFLVIFAVDKLALVPSIRQYGRRDSTPMENIIISFARLRQQRAGHLQRLRTDEQAPRPEYIFFGSSRSEMFEYLHPQTIRTSVYVNPAQKKTMLRSEFETRGIIRASDLWVIYTLLKTLLASGPLPKQLIIEVSPEMLNQNSPHSINTYVRSQTYDYQLLLDAYIAATGNLKTELLHRLLFASYAYGFRPEKAIRNFVQGKNYLNNAEMAIGLLLNMRPKLKPLPEHPEAYTGKKRDMAAEIYQSRFVDYTNLMVRKSILKNYHFSDTELRVLKKIIETAHANGLHLLLWTPFVHENLRSKWELLGVTKDFLRVERMILDYQRKGYDLSYHKLRQSDLNCVLWADSSHLSDVCAVDAFRALQASASKDALWRKHK